VTTVSDSEVLFMFVTPNGEGTARGKSGRLFMLRATFCIKICDIYHCVIQCYCDPIVYVTPQGTLWFRIARCGVTSYLVCSRNKI